MNMGAVAKLKLGWALVLALAVIWTMAAEVQAQSTQNFFFFWPEVTRQCDVSRFRR